MNDELLNFALEIYDEVRIKLLSSTDYIEFSQTMDEQIKNEYRLIRQLIRDFTPEIKIEIEKLGFEFVTPHWILEKIQIKITNSNLTLFKEFKKI